MLLPGCQPPDILATQEQPPGTALLLDDTLAIYIDEAHWLACQSPPKLLYIGPHVPDEREPALHCAALAASHEAAVENTGPRQAVRGRQELACIQAAPDQLGRVHQILHSAAQRCSMHSPS